DSMGMRNYFAIPFAAPPVGELRWAPPAPPASWTAPLANVQSAAPCLQTSASPFRLKNDQEDCLYLDVHAPTGQGPFPVMVWIHGGAFNTGGAVTYADASPLVSKGVIVVVLAYRMGPLGFLGHPALRAADGSVGNYGIMDQQAALHWVQDNIAAFAGDKNNVTIFGESAGGFSVMTHLASPLSKGLFHKAIVESGGYAFDRQLKQDMLEATSTTVVNNAMVAAGVTCATVDAACLRGLPTAVIANQLAVAFNTAAASPVPSVDGKVLTRSIKDTFAAGDNSHVPVLNGSNEDEYALFIAIGEIGRRAAAMPPNFDPANTSFSLTATAYPATLAGLAAGTGLTGPTLMSDGYYPLTAYGATAALQPSLGASAMGTDVVFACQGLNIAKRVLAQGSPVWSYEFRDQTALPSVGFDATGNYYLSFSQGAAHSYELQYLFNLRDLQNDERRALQDSMTRYWTNFARTGDPNQGTAPAVAWPAFTGGDKVLGLDVASGGGIKPLELPLETAHRCPTIWTALTF
ncbi:MAG TPA: carboxylesterase family protein, partial [Kofleriaceae bacterium]|nr:carboxylesterase family protein [Kofleriaceae bacterium]